MLAQVFLIVKIFDVVIRQATTHLQGLVSTFIHRQTYKAGSNPKNIVVVGASFAGYNAAKTLVNCIPSGYRVIVIERNSHFQFTWVLPRFSVVEGHDMKAFIPYDTVEEIVPREDGNGEGQVRLSSGERVDYEYLLLATGSSAALPSRVGAVDKKDGMKALQAQQEKILASRDIVVIGGGPAGVEIAADTKDRYPDKNITLIHSRQTLLNHGFGTKIHMALSKALVDLGVNLVMGEKPTIPSNETGDIELRGRSIHFDCLIKCIGQKPNTSLAKFASAFSKSGYIHVKPSLQIDDERYTRIYVAGDVIDAGDIKNGRSAMQQGQLAAKNIVRNIYGKKQVQYEQKWWEGLTKLTMGLTRSVAYISDEKAELVISSSSNIDLDSKRVWKFFGATPYLDPTVKSQV
ncbi:hypothetical protein N7450_011806 [Penicillium hetheringtonii]|uniref:FAD/NAD(P)-binding domain-containing protein n=1 Tax=Penicillium hetheringtonii TaxID=911720 RepID=A0AAD6DAR2_9EURO|nr:hypothetical protein N7450_011806 [Penicillium hetheringtonii]